MQYLTGKIAAKIAALSNTCLQEISGKHSNNLEEFIRYMKKDPIARQCAEVKALRLILMFGEYQHPNKEVRSFIRTMLKNLDGSLHKVVGQLGSAMPLGFSAAEIEFAIHKRKLVVKSLDCLDQRRITFQGSGGRIQTLFYRDNIKKPIPYLKVLHVTNGYTTDTDDPFGNPEMESAIQFIKAKNAVLGQMVVAGKNLATGIIVAKVVDRAVKLYDRTGKELARLPATEAMARQLESLENNTWMVTDKDNDVSSIQTGDGSQFWTGALTMFDKYIMRSFSVPDLVFTEGSYALSRTATLAGKHFSIMDSTVQAVVEQIRDEIIEKAIKPVIRANWGSAIDDYGTFEVSKDIDGSMEAENLQAIIGAVSMGILDGQNDMEVVNRLRKGMGLSEINEAEKERLAAKAQAAQAAVAEGQGAEQVYP